MVTSKFDESYNAFLFPTYPVSAYQNLKARIFIQKLNGQKLKKVY